jgi:hypothetical protein
MVLTSCVPTNEDVTSKWNLPPELKNYKVIEITDSTGITLFVLVKKEGEDRPVIGTTDTGKNPMRIIVIDDTKVEVNGETYLKLEK